MNLARQMLSTQVYWVQYLQYLAMLANSLVVSAASKDQSGSWYSKADNARSTLIRCYFPYWHKDEDKKETSGKDAYYQAYKRFFGDFQDPQWLKKVEEMNRLYRKAMGDDGSSVVPEHLKHAWLQTLSVLGAEK